MWTNDFDQDEEDEMREQTLTENQELTLRTPLDRPDIKRKPAQRRVPVQHEKKVSHLRGFGPMTRISTSFGDVPAQALRERDMVRTRAGQFLPIKWIDRIVLDEGFLKFHPRALPIVFRAGSLGQNLPKRDVMLAPFQRITPQQMILGTAPDTAQAALNRSNVFRQTEHMITYTLFHVGKPVSVLCEGLWVETAP